MSNSRHSRNLPLPVSREGTGRTIEDRKSPSVVLDYLNQRLSGDQTIPGNFRVVLANPGAQFHYLDDPWVVTALENVTPLENAFSSMASKWARLPSLDYPSLTDYLGRLQLPPTLPGFITFNYDRELWNVLGASASTEQPVSNSSQLQQRYKELNSKHYTTGLTTEEQAELNEVERQLDDIDDNDADLAAFADQIDEGYDRLGSGLRRINGILDELLND